MFARTVVFGSVRFWFRSAALRAGLVLRFRGSAVLVGSRFRSSAL